MRSLTGGLLIGVWLVCGPVWAAPEPEKPTAPAPSVRYRNDKVSLDVRDVGLDVVLKAIAKESGAELVGAPRTDRTITIALQEAPMAEALERLVGAQNFTLKYDEGGKLKVIELRGDQLAAEKPKPVEPGPTAEGNTTPPKWYAFYKAFDRSETFPISGDLRKATGREEASYDFLGNTAIGDKDPKIRAAALRAIMKQLDQDPDMKASVVASLTAMTDTELAAFARKTMYYRAEDVIRNVLRETSDRELRSRAREVLRELRKAPYKGPKFDMH